MAYILTKTLWEQVSGDSNPSAPTKKIRGYLDYEITPLLWWDYTGKNTILKHLLISL